MTNTIDHDDVKTIITTACGEFAEDFDIDTITNEFMDHLDGLDSEDIDDELHHSEELWDIIANHTFDPYEEIPAQHGQPTVHIDRADMHNTGGIFPYRDIIATYLAAHGIGVTHEAMEDTPYRIRHEYGFFAIHKVDGMHETLCGTMRGNEARHAIGFVRETITKIKPPFPPRVRYR